MQPIELKLLLVEMASEEIAWTVVVREFVFHSLRMNKLGDVLGAAGGKK